MTWRDEKKGRERKLDGGKKIAEDEKRWSDER